MSLLLLVSLSETLFTSGFARPPLSHHSGCSSFTVRLFPNLQFPSLHPDPKACCSGHWPVLSLFVLSLELAQVATLTLGNSAKGASIPSPGIDSLLSGDWFSHGHVTQCRMNEILYKGQATRGFWEKCSHC